MADGGEGSFCAGSEIIPDFSCELCIDESKQVKAEGYCARCRDFLCGSCYSGHRKTRSTRHHVLQDKSNMPKDTPLSTDRASKDIATTCMVHSGELAKYYCKSHTVLGCANCFATDHRQCSDVESVAQKSENKLGSWLYKDFISKLKLMQKKSRDIEARASENKTVSHRCLTDVVSMIRTLKEEAIVKLNEFEKRTVMLAKKMISEDEERMASVIEYCNVLSEKITQLSSKFESLQSSKRICQLSVNMRETEGEVKRFHEELSRLEEVNVVRTFIFEPNAGLTSLLRSPDVLGTISHQYQQVRTRSPVTREKPSSTTAKKLEDITVRSNSNTAYSCCISGSAVVSNNRLIITDSRNNNIKLVDTHTNTLLSVLNVPSQPWDITVFNKTQAAVSLPDSNTILMIKVSPSLTQEREITVRGICRGLAYNQERLLVTFESNPRLEIIDLHGNVIRTIENGCAGSKLFTRPWYVCVSRDGETIYVSDYSRNSVISLTCDGVVKAIYKDNRLSGPYKVCTGYHGNIYVCGCWSKNVHKITVDSKKITVILTQADVLDRHVWSVSHCQDTNRLFMMVVDVIKVYQLS